jgi:hypothetical protein
LMICGTNPNMVNEAAAMPNTIHNICFFATPLLTYPFQGKSSSYQPSRPLQRETWAMPPLPACRSQALHRTPLFSTAWDDDLLPSNHPRPMKGIWVARMVINCTFASNGRLAM